MIFSRTSLALASVAFAFATSALAQTATETKPADAQEMAEVKMIDATADTVLATVNGTEITVGNVLALMSRLPAQYLQIEDEALFAGIVDQLVQQELLAQRVPGNEKRIAVAIANETRALLATEAIDRIAKAAATDEAIEALYKERYVDIAPTQDFFASHILVETEEEAVALIEELNNGKDFAELAKEKSIGPSGPAGGELGWIEPGQTVPEFETAAMALKAGEVSAPTKSDFGWHVIKMKELRDHKQPELAEVREELASEISDAAVQSALAVLQDGQDVKMSLEGINPSVIRDQTLLD